MSNIDPIRVLTPTAAHHPSNKAYVDLKNIPATATSLQLENQSSIINTTDKLLGKKVYNTNTGITLFAAGPLVSDVWNTSSGTGITYTPLLDLNNDPSLLVHLKFDEVSGTIIDSVGAGAIAKVPGTGSITQNQTAIIDGKAIKLLGDGRLTLSPVIDLALGTDWTFSSHFSLDAIGNLAYLCHYNTGADGIGIMNPNADSIRCQLSGVNYTAVSPTITFATATNYHLAVTCDGTTGELLFYLNGTQYAASGTVPSGKTLGVESFGGHGNGTANDLDGTLDDARYYNKKLSALDIIRLQTDPYATASTNTDANITGDGSVLKVIKVTQAEYDALTPVTTTFYVIEG